MKRWLCNLVLAALVTLATSLAAHGQTVDDDAQDFTQWQTQCSRSGSSGACVLVLRTLKMLEAAGFDTRGSFELLRNGDGQVEAWRLSAYRLVSNERYQWCGWVTSCAPERLYPSAAAAEREAASLARRGYASDAAPVPFIHRPRGGTVLTPSMLAWPDADIVYVISEEVARQSLRAPDEAFARSYAAAVARAMVMRWTAGLPPEVRLATLQREVDRAVLLRDLWEIDQQVRALPDLMLSASGKRARQEELLEALRARVASSPTDVTGGRLQLSRLATAQLNVAHLDALPYRAPYVAAFEAMLHDAGGDMRAFNTRVADLALAPRAERVAVLQSTRVAARK